jgi:hypothetical protein
MPSLSIPLVDGPLTTRHQPQNAEPMIVGREAFLHLEDCQQVGLRCRRHLLNDPHFHGIPGRLETNWRGQ